MIPTLTTRIGDSYVACSNCVRSTLRSFYVKLVLTKTYSTMMISYLWARTFQGKPFEKSQIKLVGQSSSNLVRLMLDSPKSFNQRIAKDIKLYKLERDLFGMKDSEYENALGDLQILSKGLEESTPIQSMLNMKMTRILSAVDLSSLSVEDKLEKSDLYILYLANKAQQVYLKFQGKHAYLDAYFEKNKEFFGQCLQIIDRSFKEINLSNRSLLFFVDEEYHKSKKIKTSRLEGLYQWIRRGAEVHVAMLKSSLHDPRPKQVHITFHSYENNALRFVDLLSSNFITLDLTKFIAENGKQYLQEIYGTSEYESHLNQLWASSFESIISESTELNQIKNSGFRRALCVLKWFGILRKIEDFDSAIKKKEMICSEFVISLTKKILDEMEKKLIKEYADKTSQTLTDGVIINNPFRLMIACNMTPGDVSRVVSKYKSESFSGSLFLQKVIVNAA